MRLELPTEDYKKRKGKEKKKISKSGSELRGSGYERVGFTGFSNNYGGSGTQTPRVLSYEINDGKGDRACVRAGKYVRGTGAVVARVAVTRYKYATTDLVSSYRIW